MVSDFYQKVPPILSVALSRALDWQSKPKA